MSNQNGASPVPNYWKWYSSPKMAPAVRRRTMTMAAEPEPEPEPWHVIWDFSSSDSYYKGGPSGSGDHLETVDLSFTVPSAPVPKPTTENPVPEPPEPLEASCNMTLTVDDWGKMSVGDQTIDMTSGGAGPQGGHAKWTQESGDFNLKSGSYTLHVEQSNIDYDPKDKNLSICDYAFESTLGLVESSLAAAKDAYGRASGYSLQYGGGTVLQTGWGYDSAGRPSTVSLNAVATPFTYGYNAANGLLETLNYRGTP